MSPMSYCNRCLQLFSPEGITEACSEKGFVHSRVSGYFVLKYREECSLCWFINEEVYRKLRPMALSGFLSPSEDEHLRVWAYPADPSVREKAVASNMAYKLEFRMTTHQKRYATYGTGLLEDWKTCAFVPVTGEGLDHQRLKNMPTRHTFLFPRYLYPDTHRREPGSRLLSPSTL